MSLHTTKPTCNICGGTVFEEFRGRPGEQCANCGSKARHRVAWWIYKTHFANADHDLKRPVLHLAPEPSLSPPLQDLFGPAYIAADPNPAAYSHASCLKLFFPKGYEFFPDRYFSIILHNHVMEHIPGDYVDHLQQFKRLLIKGGKMIFSVPGPYLDFDTIQGGEFLETDEERLERFLQEDHFKLFGKDFEDNLQNAPGWKLHTDEMTDDIRREIAVRPGKVRIYVIERID